MIGRIVEIAGDGRYLSLKRGFLVISYKGKEVGHTPIDDVAALIGNAHGLIYSNNLLVALAKRNIPFVLCGANHKPVGILWPVESHHRQAARMDAQLRASLPMRKRLWKQIVQAKIGMQATVIGLYGGTEPPLRRMIGKVRSGDPSNIEGQAARLYWRLLFGNDFRRDRDLEDINAMLNYGYTVLRAMVARHTIAAGLHPGIPLHHANAGNAMRLVDDLMEPFRPLVDAIVRKLADNGQTELGATTRRELAILGIRSLYMPYGVSPVSVVIQRFVQSLTKALLTAPMKLELPATQYQTVRALWDEPQQTQQESRENS